MRSVVVSVEIVAVVLGLVVASCSSSSSTTSSGGPGGSSGGGSSGTSGSSGSGGDDGGGVVPDGGHACNVPSDCPPNPGAACIRKCADGSNPCATVCVSHLCALAGCP